LIQAGFIALLKNDSATSALIGAKIFQGATPPDLTQYPCASFKLVGGSGNPTFRTSGVNRQRVEFNGHATDYPTADAIRTAITNALDGWTQKLDDGTNVITTLQANPGTDFEPGEARIFRCMVEFYVLYTQPS